MNSSFLKDGHSTTLTEIISARLVSRSTIPVGEATGSSLGETEPVTGTEDNVCYLPVYRGNDPGRGTRGREVKVQMS